MDFLIGTYTHGMGEPETAGQGVYCVSFDPEAVTFGVPDLVAEQKNPSALTIDRSGGMVFAARELFRDDGPGVTAYRLGAYGGLDPVSEITVGGELPCHLAFDPDHRRLASAQYWTGDVAVCKVDGGLREVASLARSGSGPNPDRQEGPHAHCVAFTDKGNVLHLADLGTDRVASHRLGADGTSVEMSEVEFPAGAGPRHFVVNAEETRAYVICELSEELAVLTREGLGWRLQEIVPGFVCPAEVEGSTAAIRLSPDERFVYVSGRRQSRIACFAVDGGPKRIGDFPTGGVTPRDFILTADGNWVICANQDTGTLCAMRRDASSGRLSDVAAACEIPRPVAVLQI